MKNTFGSSVTLTLFGESHGPEIGAVLDGLAPGIPVDEARIAHQLSLRRPVGRISTSRVEPDPFRIVSGVFEGKTTGTPLCILIPNTNTRSADYQKELPRPGHADYTAECKYHGFADYRGGGHFSGRLTAPLVAAGAILLSSLEAKGICIGTHIAQLESVRDRAFGELAEDISALREKSFPVLSPEAASSMQAAIEAAAGEGDSVGGILESAVIGLPEGVGEPWFDTVEGLLSHALFSIPAVKGVEFGAGFGFAAMRGSEANDPFCVKEGRILTSKNHNGGVNGGITNGMPITFRVAMRPTPSIAKQQQTVSLSAKTNETLVIEGRHDPCIVKRALPVIEAAAALAVCELFDI